MPSELRVLRFKLEEIAEALRGFAARLAIAVPGTPLTAMEPVEAAGGQAVALSFQGCAKPVTVSKGELAASLIAWCQGNGVMLPRESRKQIFVSEAFAELRMGVRHEQAAGPEKTRVAI